MTHFARPLALLTLVAGLLACDQAGNAPVASTPSPDTTTVPQGTNDVLVRATPLVAQPLWVPVRPIAPPGWVSGSAWYALDLDSGLTVQISLKDSAFTSAAMELFAADSTLLRTIAVDSGATPGLQRIRYESTGSERVYLVVHGSTRSLLEICIELLPEQETGPDAYEGQDSGSEFQGGPSVSPDSVWINRTLHRTAGGVMESGDYFQIAVDSSRLYTLHLVWKGNGPAIEFLPRGMRPIDTTWTIRSSKNTTEAHLTFAAYRTGRVLFLAKPSGTDAKPVHYRLAATSREGIPAGIYPDVYEIDDTPEFASLLFPLMASQIRTLHRDRGIPDVDQILLLNPGGSEQILEIHDTLGTLRVEAFAPDGTPVAPSETVTGSVRTFLVAPVSGGPVRLRVSNPGPSGANYRLSLRDR